MPKADLLLERALASYGVRVLRDARVADLDARRIRVTTPEGDQELGDLSYAHVVPHYRAPGWVAESGLADATEAGLVDVDPGTLRHRRHAAVWSLGDVADLGSAFGRRPAQAGRGPGPQHRCRWNGLVRHYDGYTVMPITVARHQLMLVEVDRDGQQAPTAPFPDLVRPRRATWVADRSALPVTYFRRILRGKV